LIIGSKKPKPLCKFELYQNFPKLDFYIQPKKMKINHLIVMVLSVCMCISKPKTCADSEAQGSEIPTVHSKERVSNEIDYSVLEKSENNPVKPKPTADDKSLRFS
jgi:hypothetical protein